MSSLFHTSVSSRRHPAVAHALTLLQGPAARRQASAYLAEGVKVIREAVLSHAPFLRVFVSPRLLAEAGGTALLSLLERRSIQLLPVKDHLLELLAHTRTPQGVTAMIRLPSMPDVPPPPKPGYPLLVTWKVQDPGNMGSLVRTAEALGVSGMVAAGGGADPYHPRAVRAAAGSIFRLVPACPPTTAALVEPLKKAGYRLLAAVPQRGRKASSLKWDLPWALLLGGEGSGLPARLVQRAAARVSIPMTGKVESLSVPAAAAALLYEAARARPIRPGPRVSRARGAARSGQRPPSSRSRPPRSGTRDRTPVRGKRQPKAPAGRSRAIRPGRSRSSGVKRRPASPPSNRNRKGPEAV